MNSAVKNLQVLVVDDSAVYRKLVEHALEGDCYLLLFAKNGREAFDLYDKHMPELVITDWMMPDFSGLELCQRIRNDARPGYSYVILLTASADKGNVVKGLAAGADDYLTKPFDLAELQARIGVGRRIIELNREVAAKNRMLQEMAHTDPLTGLPNRRAIYEWAGRQLRGATRHGFPFWVVLADLDGFKKVNDTYGHAAGDSVLQRFTEILRSHTRASDFCGRLGGDEFLMVITHVSPENIDTTVERFREEVEAEEFQISEGKLSLTASFGIAGHHSKDEVEFGALVRQADKALYAAKRGGRNRVNRDLGSPQPLEVGEWDL
ncbi:MAG TPA: diguanylate cyclase [Candidatus Saccharimonadales bacterium]|jgi:two-component system cell cycle response regulator|nr:diguanylate cyclase [Candidatus Saccharimonadales bacterium]